MPIHTRQQLHNDSITVIMTLKGELCRSDCVTLQFCVASFSELGLSTLAQHSQGNKSNWETQDMYLPPVSPYLGDHVKLLLGKT